ncbi:hypothetical protein [Neorhizobium sp. NCHU2750]|uniref:hypothetical protein n=1 Tax=Neorhizobium sp. NCHU2750 TaxID=1825976 RepID=UPI000E73C1CD|nr:membrane protein [Neorhizobium sp. NCHU2750]
MSVPHYISLFLGGAFLMNAVPHVVSGVLGRPFQSPFAKPHGVGLSSSTVNTLWGFANLVVAYILIITLGALQIGEPADVLAAGLGAFGIALFCARHFGQFHGGTMAKRP